MKLAQQVNTLMAEGDLEVRLPQNVKLNKVYKTVTVDGEKFSNLKLIGIHPVKSELYFTGNGTKHTFDYIEQDVKL